MYHSPRRALLAPPRTPRTTSLGVLGRPAAYGTVDPATSPPSTLLTTHPSPYRTALERSLPRRAPPTLARVMPTGGLPLGSPPPRPPRSPVRTLPTAAARANPSCGAALFSPPPPVAGLPPPPPPPPMGVLRLLLDPHPSAPPPSAARRPTLPTTALVPLSSTHTALAPRFNSCRAHAPGHRAGRPHRLWPCREPPCLFRDPTTGASCRLRPPERERTGLVSPCPPARL
ncbi:unnamed protein product [Dicrocoelium dendriticum]|nr:unnamed protein product [Dicrocoelium dendriticum]